MSRRYGTKTWRLFQTAPQKYLNGKIHLYRKPGAMAHYMEYKWSDSEPFQFGKVKDYHGPSWTEWQFRIKRLCPLQFFFRETLMDHLDRYWFIVKYNPKTSFLEWNHDNWHVKDFNEFIYKLKCRFIKPYNVIKINSLPCTYSDPVEQMLHVNFQLLLNYIEERDRVKKMWEDIDLDVPLEEGHVKSSDEIEAEAERAAKEKELNNLRDWWLAHQETHEKWQSDFDKFWEGKDKDTDWLMATIELDKKIEADKEEHLIKLVKMRNNLWV